MLWEENIEKIKELLEDNLKKQYFLKISSELLMENIDKEEYVRLMEEEKDSFIFNYIIDEKGYFFKAQEKNIEEDEEDEEDEEIYYMDELEPVDRLFHCEVVSHGLDAFRGGDPIAKLQKIINNIHINGIMEICAAHKSQHIGPVGVYVMGFVHCVSNFDLYSEYCKSEIRYITEDNLDKLIYTKEEIDLSQHSHMEYIVTPRKICGIWYKEEVSKDLLLKLQKIAAKLKIKIYKVK